MQQPSKLVDSGMFLTYNRDVRYPSKLQSITKHNTQYEMRHATASGLPILTMAAAQAAGEYLQLLVNLARRYLTFSPCQYHIELRRNGINKTMQHASDNATSYFYIRIKCLTWVELILTAQLGSVTNVTSLHIPHRHFEELDIVDAHHRFLVVIIQHSKPYTLVFTYVETPCLKNIHHLRPKTHNTTKDKHHH